MSFVSVYFNRLDTWVLGQIKMMQRVFYITTTFLVIFKMFHHSVDEEILDDPGGLEDWERELEEEEERKRRDLEAKPRNDFAAKKKETEAEQCPHCFM